MIDHVEIKTGNIEDAVRFYADVLAPLGYEMTADERTKGFGVAKRIDFFLVEATPATDAHFAFEAPSRTIVDAIHDLAASRGHKLDRAPALAPHIHPNYYAGYLRDPDDRLVEFVCHAAE